MSRVAETVNTINYLRIYQMGVAMALSETDADRLRSIHLFKNLGNQYLPTLLESASIQQFPRRAILFTEGDRASSLYTLIHGSVELFSEHRDRRSTIALIRSSKPFVLTSTVDDGNPVSARTLERSKLLLFPIKVIRDLMAMDLRFACAIVLELAGDLRNIIEVSKSHKLRTSVERLAEWMLRTDQNAGGTCRFAIPP
jgi:CRP/FNR family transcriptional regulator, transcriptional activator FtrB